jgi:hypothetical protein
MPTWDEILNEVEQLNPLKVLEDYIAALSDKTRNTTICYMSAFSIIKPPVPSPYHSIIDQDIQGFMTCSKGINKDALDLILHTPGGDYEATKRIINYLHETYKCIRVFVPHMAMSGGTLMACGADEIFMGPYSSLGPTDPQVFLGNNYVPVNAIIIEFERAFKEVSEDPKKALLWNERLKQIPFGRLSAAETMRDNTLRYLKDLLKMRNCPDKNDGQIEKIAEFLNNPLDHSSHGKGISLKEAMDKKLNVKDLRKDKELEDAILSIYHSAIILFEKTKVQKVIINNIGRRYINVYPLSQ